MSMKVSLLGSPRVIADGQELVFPYRKAEGLFYYLCLKGSVSRDEAIGIFWADCSENSARKNLRDVIYHLKKLLGEDVVYTEGNNRINLSRDKIDSIDYEELTDDNILERYTGDFLGYFYIKNCMEFEDWATGIREELLRKYQKAARNQVSQVSKGNEVKAIVNCAGLLLRKRILEEELYRELLSGLLRLGACTEAREVYEKLQTVLMEELGTKPEESTSNLMQEAVLMKAERPGTKQSEQSKEYFFGREKEMLFLLSNLSNFYRGEKASSILLTGEAGVGKSTIMSRLRDVMEDDRYLAISYQCVQTEEELYLKPWNDILAQAEKLCRSLRISCTTAPNFYAKQIDMSLFATQYEIFAESTMRTLAENLTGKKIVLFIDDVQWMDNASKRLLCNLMFWADNKKLLMVLTGRDDCAKQLLPLRAAMVGKGVLKEVVVSRFTREETQQIISERRPELLDEPDKLDQIYRDTDGNALFLLEYLKELEHGGSPGKLSERATGMIQSRLVNLTGEEWELLNGISLQPRFATIEELQIISGQTSIQMLRNLEHLLARQLICLKNTYNKSGYGFFHQIIRDYIYNSMLEDKRQLLHQMVAEAMEQKYERTEDISMCPMLIYHFSRCNNVYKTYTYRLEYLRAFYSTQHDIYPTVITEEMHFDGRLRRLTGEDELVNLAEQIRSLHQRSEEIDPLRMKVEFIIGRYDLFSGAFDKGLKNIQMSIQLAQKLHDGKYLMQDYLQMVFHAIQIHNLKMFNEYLTLCEGLLRQYTYTEAETCTVLRLRGVYHMKNFQYSKAEEIFQEVIRRIEPFCRADTSYRVGLAACYNYIGEGRQAMNRWDEALKYYLLAIRRCEGEQMVSGLGVFYSNAGYVLCRKGELDQAQEYIDKANDCFEKLGTVWGHSKAKCYAALLAMKKGDWEAARQHYLVARDIAQKVGNPSVLALVYEVERQLQKHQEEQKNEST